MKGIRFLAGRGRLWPTVMLLAVLLTACGTPRPSVSNSSAPDPNTAAIVSLPGVASTSGGNGQVNGEAGLSKVEWLGLQGEAAASWIIVRDPADALRVKVLLKDKSAVAGPEKKLFVMIPRPVPSSFDLALSIILKDFLDRKIAATFTVVNWSDNQELARKALEYAVSQKYDLIFSMGSDTTSFIHKNFQGGSIPVVTLQTKDPVLQGLLPNYKTTGSANIAYTSVNASVDLQMKYMRELMPELKNITIMYERSNTSTVETQVTPLRKAAAERNINLVDVIVDNTRQSRAELEAKMPGAIEQMRQSDPTLKNSFFWLTGSSSIFGEMETVSRVAGNTPVLSVFPDVVKDGALLSIGVSFSSNAHQATAYAIDILQGNRKPGDFEVGVIAPPDIAINFKKAREIGLKIPFNFFESASTIYDYDGKLVRKDGKTVE